MSGRALGRTLRIATVLFLVEAFLLNQGVLVGLTALGAVLGGVPRVLLAWQRGDISRRRGFESHALGYTSPSRCSGSGRWSRKRTSLVRGPIPSSSQPANTKRNTVGFQTGSTNWSRPSSRQFHPRTTP